MAHPLGPLIQALSKKMNLQEPEDSQKVQKVLQLENYLFSYSMQFSVYQFVLINGQLKKLFYIKKDPMLQTTIKLPLYTIVANSTNSNDLSLKIYGQTSVRTYNQVRISNDDELFNTFQNFSDFLDHIKTPEHTSVNFTDRSLVIFANGLFGKNRKCVKIAKFQMEVVDFLGIQSIVQRCETSQQTGLKQLKKLLCHLAKNLQYYVIHQKVDIDRGFRENPELEQSTRLKKQQESSTQKMQDLTQITKLIQLETERVLKGLQEKLKDFDMEFRQQLVRLQSSFKNQQQKVKEVQNQVKDFCVQFRKKEDQKGTYVGMLVDGKETGKGKYRWRDGEKYIGDFIQGKRTGKGEYLYTNGDRYIGDFIDGKLHGRGTYYFSDGNKYEGQWAYDKYDGLGQFSFSDGDRMRGKWKNDKKQGNFIYDYRNGFRQKRLYLKDELVKFKRVSDVIVKTEQ